MPRRSKAITPLQKMMAGFASESLEHFLRYPSLYEKNEKLRDEADKELENLQDIYVEAAQKLFLDRIKEPVWAKTLEGKVVKGYLYYHLAPHQITAPKEAPQPMIVSTGFADWGMERPVSMNHIDIETLSFEEIKE